MAGDRLGEKVVWQMLREYAEAAGVPGIAPHDARRTKRRSAWCLDGVAVTRLCRKDPKLGLKLLQGALSTAAGRVQGLEERLAEFCGLSCVGK